MKHILILLAFVSFLTTGNAATAWLGIESEVTVTESHLLPKFETSSLEEPVKGSEDPRSIDLALKQLELEYQLAETMSIPKPELNPQFWSSNLIIPEDSRRSRNHYLHDDSPVYDVSFGEYDYEKPFDFAPFILGALAGCLLTLLLTAFKPIAVTVNIPAKPEKE